MWSVLQAKTRPPAAAAVEPVEPVLSVADLQQLVLLTQCLQLLLLYTGAHCIYSKIGSHELHVCRLTLGIDGSIATLLLLLTHVDTFPTHLACHQQLEGDACAV
jgi:hypothetical protein